MDFLNRFAAHFGVPADAAAAAPGRLEVLGNHTDYNQGLVLSCAVEQTTRFAVAKKPGRLCRLKDFRDGSERSFDINDIDHALRKDWSNYIRGVVVGLRKRNIEIGAFDGGIESNVPLSAGMSSSAALEVAAIMAFRQAWGFSLDDADAARVGQGVENEYLGLKTGLLDQFSSIFGKKDALILSDFRTAEVLRTIPVPAGYKFVVVNSMVKHTLVDSEYNVRRADCESAAAKLGVKALRDVGLEMLESKKNLLSDREYRRALHVVGEIDRVLRAEKALASGDAAAFGKLLFESHQSSVDNFENSTPELDTLIDLAKTIPGCLGARLSGGGFGGISIHFVEAAAAEEYARRIRQAYRIARGVEPETIICEIGQGARAIA